MTVRFTAISIAILAFCFLGGCSNSSTTQASSESSSDSSSSPSRSSGSSEKSEDGETAYERDVRDYTAAFAASDGDVESFQRDLSEIAGGYGMSDWERNEATFVAIGSGLAMAEVGDRRYRALAIELSNEDFERLALVKSGYETYRLR
jgi:hypothetical protein